MMRGPARFDMRYAKLTFLAAAFAAACSAGGCSCGGGAVEDAISYDNVKKSKEKVSAAERATAPKDAPAKQLGDAPMPDARPPQQAAQPERNASVAPQAPQAADRPGDGSRRDERLAKRFQGAGAKAELISVEPAAPGCENARSEARKRMKSAKFPRDMASEPLSSVAPALADCVGFKFRVDPAVAEVRIDARSSGRPVQFAIRQIVKSGVFIKLTANNELVFGPAEPPSQRKGLRGEKPPAGQQRPGARQAQGQVAAFSGNDEKAPQAGGRQDVEVFEDADIF